MSYSINKKPLQRKPIQLIDSDADNFSVGSKKRKQARQDNRKELKTVKIDAKKSKVENRRSKADSRVILAKQGIIQTSDTGQALQGLGGLVSGAIGGLTGGAGSKSVDLGNGDTTPVPKPPVYVSAEQLKNSPLSADSLSEEKVSDTGTDKIAPDAKKTDTVTKKNNTLLYIIGSVTVIAIFLKFKKK